MKKLFTVLLIFSLLCGLHVYNTSGNTDVAEDITKRADLQLVSGSGAVARLKDRSVYSACSSTGRFELKITSDEPIYGIYFWWNNTPPHWTLTGKKEILIGGQNGFWHEYKALGGETSYTLSWEGTGDLADIFLLSAGALPDFVQVWEPPCEKADFLLLPTHADDEHLWFGGTMPYYAGELGYEIQVVYLMKHVYYRHHELINGLWEVGVTNYPVISEFIDKYCANLAQAKSYYPEEEVEEFLVESIRRFKPEVIVAHDLNGEYGHGAHILNATVLSEKALASANDPTKFPESFEKYGAWETKKCYLHLYQENEIFINWKEKALTAFDGVNAYDMAQRGFEQHKSQVAYFSMSLDNRARYGNGLFGLFFSTVGPDVLKNDFLENVPPECLTTWIAPEPEPEPPKSEPVTELPATDVSSAESEIPQGTSESRDKVIAAAAIVSVALIGSFFVCCMAVFPRMRKNTE